MQPTNTKYFVAAVLDMGGAGGPQSRRIVSGLGRAELEDKHLSLLDENHVRSFPCNNHCRKMRVILYNSFLDSSVS